MQNSRTIFIGDIHGCLDELQLLLKKLDLTQKDQVYLTGDIIHKGPKSFETLKYIFDNQDKIKLVIGNNEVNFLRWLDSGEPDTPYKSFYKLREKIGDNIELIDFLRKLPLYIETDNFILLHGGKIPEKELQHHNIDEITRIREYKGEPWYNYYKEDKKIIYGHWAKDGLRIRKNTIGLDSGCTYGKMLTAYTLETGEIIQQNALNIYVNIYESRRT